MRKAAAFLLRPGGYAGCLIVLLGGCAALTVPAPGEIPELGAPAQEISRFRLSGRIAVKHNEQGFSGSLRWEHAAARDEMFILSPLGQVVARIERDAAGAALTTSDQQTLRADDAESLTAAALGWRLPLAGLQYWVLGRPAPIAPAVIERNGDNRVSRLRQHGWRIDYLEYAALPELSLPGKILLQRENLEVKLIIDSWDLSN